MDGLPLSDVMVALLDFQPLRAYQRRAPIRHEFLYNVLLSMNSTKYVHSISDMQASPKTRRASSAV